MADQDKPKVNLSFADLDNEATPEPFVYTTKASKRVTFPDLYALEAMEAEKFFADMNSDQPDSTMLQKWLSADDYEALQADRLSLRARVRLVRAATEYYESTVGGPGEGNASEN